jgi:hypothetical protein
MSLAEVESLLGPAGGYVSGPLKAATPAVESCFYSDEMPVDRRQDRVIDWTTDTARVWVEFDTSLKAVAASYVGAEHVHQSHLENLKWRADRPPLAPFASLVHELMRQRQRWFPEK